MSSRRPCQYCVANWAGMASPGSTPIVPTEMDCEWDHRDDPRVYALARSIARTICGTRKPSDEQIGWYLGDANDVVDDFEPAPEKWSVHRVKACAEDGFDEIEIRLRINGVTYIGLEGGKGERGQLLKLSTYRSWGK